MRNINTLIRFDLLKLWYFEIRIVNSVKFFNKKGTSYFCDLIALCIMEKNVFHCGLFDNEFYYPILIFQVHKISK